MAEENIAVAASIDEDVLQTFRVDAEAFRNLDSIIRQRCGDIDPKIHPEYDVLRADGLRYTTTDVEDLARERNGQETRIRAVRVKIGGEKDEAIRFSVAFKDDVSISGESDDRANLILLASDVRSLIREQMKSRRSMRREVRLFVVGLALLVGFVGMTLSGSQYANNFYSKFNLEYNHEQITQTRELESADNSVQHTINQYESAVKDNNVVEQKNFLTEAALTELRYDLTVGIINTSTAGQSSNPPWWTNSLWLDTGTGAAFAVIIWAISFLLYPPSGALFLIGDEIKRQARKAQLRERLIWGVGATFVLGIASALVATAIFR